MSGTRHHVIPRFLLRGFTSHTNGEASYAWVYRKDRPPYNPNIINIAVEGHFYTLDDSSDVDDRITATEGAFGSIVDAMRCSGSVDGISKEELARLISHLESRTRHLRKNFEWLGGAMFTSVLEFIADEAKFGQFVLRRFERDPHWILAPLADEIRSRGIPERQIDLLVELVRPHLASWLPTMLPSLSARFAMAMKHVATTNPAIYTAAARSGQLRGLQREIAPESKAARYSDLDFVMLDAGSRSLPLGDSAVLARIDAPRQYTTFVSADDTLLSVFLPISPSLVLCGHAPGYVPALSELPLAIARCSSEFFVSHESSPEFEQYQTRLGELAAIIDNQAIEEILLQVFSG